MLNSLFSLSPHFTVNTVYFNYKNCFSAKMAFFMKSIVGNTFHDNKGVTHSRKDIIQGRFYQILSPFSIISW